MSVSSHPIGHPVSVELGGPKRGPGGLPPGSSQVSLTSSRSVSPATMRGHTTYGAPGPGAYTLQPPPQVSRAGPPAVSTAGSAEQLRYIQQYQTAAQAAEQAARQQAQTAAAIAAAVYVRSPVRKPRFLHKGGLGADLYLFKVVEKL